MPPKSEHRDKAVTIRLSLEEWEQMKAEADSLKLSFSDYARNTLLQRPLPRPQTEISVETYKELRKIGTNINQLAAAANRATNMGVASAVSKEQWLEIYDLLKALGLEIIG